MSSKKIQGTCLPRILIHKDDVSLDPNNLSLFSEQPPVALDFANIALLICTRPSGKQENAQVGLFFLKREESHWEDLENELGSV